MTLSYTDIQEGVFFKQGNTVYETLESTFSKKSRQKGSNTVRIKEIKSGAVVSKTLHPSDKFEEAVVEKKDYVYIYQKGDALVVHEKGNKKERVTVQSTCLRSAISLPENTPVRALVEKDTILALIPPIKLSLSVKEAPPSLRGNTTQGGNKQVLTETGEKIKTPLFIETGDTIVVNTETGEYVERTKRSTA